jgi:hypothetical protein
VSTGRCINKCSQIRENLLQRVQPSPCITTLVWTRAMVCGVASWVHLIAIKTAPQKHRLEILVLARYPGCRKSQPGSCRPHSAGGRRVRQGHDTTRNYVDTLWAQQPDRSMGKFANSGRMAFVNVQYSLGAARKPWMKLVPD